MTSPFTGAPLIRSDTLAVPHRDAGGCRYARLLSAAGAQVVSTGGWHDAFGIFGESLFTLADIDTVADRSQVRLCDMDHSTNALWEPSLTNCSVSASGFRYINTKSGLT